MATNFPSEALRREILRKLAAGTPYRTLAEEYKLSRGTIFGLAKGQHSVRAQTARQALIEGATDYRMPLMVRPEYLGLRERRGSDDGFDDTGAPLFHPAGHTDASAIGRWWNDFKAARRTKFTDLSSLAKYRNRSVRVVGPSGVAQVRFLSDLDADEIRSQVAILDAGEPLEIVRYERGRGRRRVS
jgi:hypothetical protein